MKYSLIGLFLKLCMFDSIVYNTFKTISWFLKSNGNVFKREKIISLLEKNYDTIAHMQVLPVCLVI